MEATKLGFCYLTFGIHLPAITEKDLGVKKQNSVGICGIAHVLLPDQPLRLSVSRGLLPSLQQHMGRVNESNEY